MIRAKPTIKVYRLIILIIRKLFKPEYLKISNSLLSIRLIKKICVDNKKMKGNISNRIEGEFKKDKKS